MKTKAEQAWKYVRREVEQRAERTGTAGNASYPCTRIVRSSERRRCAYVAADRWMMPAVDVSATDDSKLSIWLLYELDALGAALLVVFLF
jgi:hypothetical protein